MLFRLNKTKIEEFVRFELMNIVQKKCLQLNTQLDERDKHYFFGTYHTDFQQFTFGQYERNIIHELVQHVKHIFHINGFSEGIKYFSTNDNSIQWLNNWFFCQIQPSQLNIEQSQSQLTLEAESQTHKILNIYFWVQQTEILSEKKVAIDSIR